MTFLAGQVLTADQLNTRVGTEVITADSADFTGTEVEVASITVPVVNGRAYWVTLDAGWSGGDGGASVRVRIREDTVSGTLVQIRDVYVDADTAVGYAGPLSGRYVATATESKTFVIGAGRSGGAGNMRLDASGPGLLTVDYIPGDG